MSEKPCYVYVISIDELGLSKVGISDNPATRLKQLATGSPFTMRVAHQFKVPHRSWAISLEYAFHESREPELRMRGEWFKMSADAAISYMTLHVICFLIGCLSMPEDQLETAFDLIGMPCWAIHAVPPIARGLSAGAVH